MIMLALLARYSSSLSPRNGRCTSHEQIAVESCNGHLLQDAGAVAPNMTDLLAIPGTTLSPNDPTNSTVWFAWNSTAGGFKTQQEATAAFHSFLQGVRGLLFRIPSALTVQL